MYCYLLIVQSQRCQDTKTTLTLALDNCTRQATIAQDSIAKKFEMIASKTYDM